MTTSASINGLVLQTAIEAALEAGAYFRSRFATELVVHTKTSPADVVTDVDAHCERIIRGHIEKAFPTHQVLGEEAVEPGREASVQATHQMKDEASLWIVDPLDGTTNFVNAIPLSVVSIAYASHGQIEVGVIYDPYREELFYTVRGQGAHLTTREDAQAWLRESTKRTPGMRLSVSRVSEIDHAVLATGLPMRHLNRTLMMERTMHIVKRAKSLRTLGAAALHLAYVAAGRIDVFWEFELNAWDVAAGVLLVQEAGGQVSQLDGTDYGLVTRDLIAAGEANLAREICNQLAGDDDQIE
ncbi:inositol monophosphatase family protein [Alicyclobacillus fodiniaquatilis]|uniref:Inositol-1-monophosphatase n=1 Tax=Alicyclobacillus fodiniaquatilis TaxID=1661150 RepID=A0ABW4JBH9_9BACL